MSMWAKSAAGTASERLTVQDHGEGQTAIDHQLVTDEGDQTGDDDKRPLSFVANAIPVLAPWLQKNVRFGS